MSTFLKIFLTIFLCLAIGGEAVAAELTVNKIAAVVNGEMITLHELRLQTSSELRRRRMKEDDPNAAQVQAAVLDRMINDILMLQEARRYKISIGDEDVEQEYSRLQKRSGLSAAKFEQEVKSQGMTPEAYKENIRKKLLGQRIASHMVARKVFVTPEEVEAYYRNNKDEFGGERTADFSILMLPEKVNAQSIYKQISSGGMSFEDAARAHSADQSAEGGGKVDGIPWDRLPADMQKLLSSLQDGKLSPLMRTQGGFVVIRRDRINEPRPLTFEEAKPRIEDILRAPLLEERFKEYTEQLRGKAVIDIRM